MTTNNQRTSVNISKESHALISLVAHTRRTTVGAALEQAIKEYAGNPHKLAETAVAMTMAAPKPETTRKRKAA